MSKLRAPLRELMDDSLDAARVQRMWRGIEGGARPSRRGVWALAGSLAVCLAVLVVVRSGAAGPLAAHGGGAIAFERGPVALSDGSVVGVADGAELGVIENTGRAFVLQLRKGRARFDVTPGGPRQWRIECGLASVSVVGTRFVVTRAEGTLRVEVEHGVVEVRGSAVAGGIQRLLAGQSLSVGASGTAAAGSVSGPTLSAAGPVGHAGTSPAAAGERLVHVDPGPPPSAAGARAGADPSRATGPHAPAAAALGSPSGVPARAAVGGALAARGDAVVRSGTAPSRGSRLLAEADRARLGGDEGRARGLLGQLLREHPGTPEAAIGAFSLARVQMEVEPAAAAAALKVALAAPAPRSLREDVLARLVEAYARAHLPDLAARAAEDYLREYPGGRRAAEVARWAAPP